MTAAAQLREQLVGKSPRDVIADGLLITRRATKANAEHDVKIVVLSQMAKSKITCLPSIERPSSGGWIVAGGNGLDDKLHLLTRVHQRLKAAKMQKGLTWEQLFVICDVKESGALDWNEFLFMIRGILEVPRQTLCNSDLRILFDEVDNSRGGDANGRLDIAELLQYLAKGQEDPDMVAFQTQKRILLVKRAIRVALLKAKQNIGANAKASKALFKQIDQDDSNYLSELELETFLRGELNVSHWDVLKSDLKDFYNFLDQNGDGVDIDEFLSYLNSTDAVQEGSLVDSRRALTPMTKLKDPRTFQSTRGSQQDPRLDASKVFPKPKAHTNPQQSMMSTTWTASSETSARWKARRKAHAMKSSSSPNLSHTFTTFGRDRQPSNRLAVSYMESCQSTPQL